MAIFHVLVILILIFILLIIVLSAGPSVSVRVCAGVPAAQAAAAVWRQPQRARHQVLAQKGAPALLAIGPLKALDHSEETSGKAS